MTSELKTQAKLYVNSNPDLFMLYTRDEALFLKYSIKELLDFGSIENNLDRLLTKILLSRFNWEEYPRDLNWGGEPYIFDYISKKANSIRRRKFKELAKRVEDELETRKRDSG